MSAIVFQHALHILEPAAAMNALRAMEPDLSWRCTHPGCPFELETGWGASEDSVRFRCEQHARDTGHRVGRYLDRVIDYPDEPFETIGGA